MLIRKFLLIISLLIFSHQSLAFDDDRKGFMIGIGLGIQKTNINERNLNAASNSETGMATSFKIGGGITQRFSLYYVRSASWFNAPYTEDSNTSDIYYVSGLSGLGASYYFQNSAPSAYITSAIGIGDFAAPLEDDIDSDTDTGSAFMVGGGYELNKHIQFEATYLRTSIDGKSLNASDFKTASLQFTINYLWY